MYKNAHSKRFYKDRQEEIKKIDIERRKELDNKQNNNKRILDNSRKSGIIKDELKTDKQRQHMIASPGYKEGKSYIYGDEKTAEDLYNEFSGKGDLIEYKGEWLKKERITAERTIGVYIDQNGVATETNRFMIIYSKSGYQVGMIDYEKYVGKKVLIKTKDNSIFTGEILDYDNGFNDDTNIETIIIHAINWAEHPYQEIKIVDIVSVVEV